jgi:lauroyl/myristoyl acyltransferase
MIKTGAVLAFGRLADRLHPSALELVPRVLGAALPATWWIPGNPIRRSCRDLCSIAAARGHRHEPREIYRGLVTKGASVMRGFLRAYARGPAAAAPWMAVDEAELARVRDLAASRGVVMAVPHNVGSVFSAIGNVGKLPQLVVARNRAGEGKERVARDVFRRLGIEVLLVRDTSATGVVRACFRALAEGRVLVATLDYTYRKADALPVPIFGVPKGFAPWAAALAARRKVPFLPAYPRMDGGRCSAWLGEPIVDPSPERLMEHYVRFLETSILRDPANWAFVADKRWSRHLRTAAEALPA